MAPFAFPHKADDGAEEDMELQNTAHYYPNLQPISFFESINSVLHVTKSTDANYNGSQTGSSGGLLTTPPGQGEQEEDSDVAILLALFIPLAATVTAIFIIALFVRRMRRSESVQDIHHRNMNMKNEFQMTPRQKNSAHSTFSVTSTSSSSSASSTSSTSAGSHRSSSRLNERSATPTSQTLSAKNATNDGDITSVNNATNLKKNGMSKSQNFKGSSNSIEESMCRSSSYFRMAPHPQLHYQSSLPVTKVSNSPTGLPPPWPIAPESGFFYTRSHYGLNKLHQQLYQQASLQAFSSIQSLNGYPLYRQYSSDPQALGGAQSDPEIETSSSSDDGVNNKKSSNKKLKRVLSAINFPRRIRQYQADKKRFNIYTIPVETREQLKHIYVY